MIEYLSNIPWWVYLIFLPGYLVKLGYVARMTTIINNRDPNTVEMLTFVLWPIISFVKTLLTFFLLPLFLLFTNGLWGLVNRGKRTADEEWARIKKVM